MASNDSSDQNETRFGLLTDALSQSTQKIVNNILSHKGMAECFPQLKKKKPEVLSELHATLISIVQKKLKEELEDVINEIGLKEKLDLIDKLDNEQAELSKGETVWRPSGVPSKDLLAYDMPALQNHKEELQTYLKELQAENEIEKNKIIKAVEEIAQTEELIENLLQKNEKTLSVLSNIPSL